MVWLEQGNFDALVDFANRSSTPKDKLGIMLHTLPNMNDHVLQWVTKELQGMVGWSFITSVQQSWEWWHSFSGIFEGFVGHIAAG